MNSPSFLWVFLAGGVVRGYLLVLIVLIHIYISVLSTLLSPNLSLSENYIQGGDVEMRKGERLCVTENYENL